MICAHPGPDCNSTYSSWRTRETWKGPLTFSQHFCVNMTCHLPSNGRGANCNSLTIQHRPYLICLCLNCADWWEITTWPTSQNQVQWWFLQDPSPNGSADLPGRILRCHYFQVVMRSSSNSRRNWWISIGHLEFWEEMFLFNSWAVKQRDVDGNQNALCRNILLNKLVRCQRKRIWLTTRMSTY